MVFLWSTPNRQHNGVPLPPIPLEIYHEIFDCLQPSSILTDKECSQIFAEMTKVCRFFCAEALPRLYHTLTFTTASTREGVRSVKLCRSVRNREELACHIATLVRGCAFDGWCPADANELALHDEFMILFARAFKAMPNIDSVALKSCTVTCRLLKVLSRIPLLRTLRLENCSMQLEPSSNLRNLLDLTEHVTDLTVIGTSVDVVIDIAHSSVTSLCTDVPQLYLNSEASVATMLLTRLDITRLAYRTETGLAYLSAALSLLPALTELIIHRLVFDAISVGSFFITPMFVLPEGTLPRLNTLKCPMILAKALISSSNCPLRVLDTTGLDVMEVNRGEVAGRPVETMLSNIRPLHALEELTIDICDQCLSEKDMQTYPRVRRFRIMTTGMDQVLGAITRLPPLGAWLPALEMMEISSISKSFESGMAVDLVAQAKVIQSTFGSKFGNTLKRAVITDCMEWSRDQSEVGWRMRIVNERIVEELQLKFSDDHDNGTGKVHA